MKKAREPKTERDKKATKAIFSVEGGLSNLVNALVKNIGEENICLNRSGIFFSKKENHFLSNLSDDTIFACNFHFGSLRLEDSFPFS
jgi:protoporphyrinogen/coproporphyrinogen III oxidase